MALFNMKSIQSAIKRAEPVVHTGRVTRASGVIIEATLPQMAVGRSCSIKINHSKNVTAQVVGFSGNTALLMPYDTMEGIRSGASVIPQGGTETLPVGDALLGRVVDANLKPIDNGPTPLLNERTPVQGRIPTAMERKRISEPLSLGIRAIDAFLTVGEGQRIGIFAGAGVGKSVLLGMLARNAQADIIILGLVGERGREVREFVERDLGPEGLARSVVVVATSDEAPLMRIRAALSATSLAEHYRKKR
jgi:flagellum-specific ATP synthase